MAGRVMFELPEGVQHGTPEGFAAGCRKDTTCPALYEHGMACLYAHLRSSNDPRYYRAKVRDPRPAAIARALGMTSTRAVQDVEEAESAARVAREKTSAAVAAATRARNDRAAQAKDAQAAADDAAIDEVLEQLDAGDVVDEEQLTDPTPTPLEAPDMSTTPDTIAPDTAADATPAAPVSVPKPKKPRKPPTPQPASGRTREELATIRAWARENGHQVATHGRMSARLIALYDEAQTEAPEPPTVAPNAAQPLAERAHDPEPQEDAATPVIEEEAPTAEPEHSPVDEPAAEGEAMGHSDDLEGEITVDLVIDTTKFDEALAVPEFGEDFGTRSDQLDQTRQRITPSIDPLQEAFAQHELARQLAECAVGTRMAAVMRDEDMTARVELLERLDGIWRNHTRRIDMTPEQMAETYDDVVVTHLPTEAAPADHRPDWGDVPAGVTELTNALAEANDARYELLVLLNRARDTAVRLEQESARTEQAFALTLTKWDEAKQALAASELHHLQHLAETALDRLVIDELKTQLGVERRKHGATRIMLALQKALTAAAREERDMARAQLAEPRRSWWKRGQ